jgi:hypothetical protein
MATFEFNVTSTNFTSGNNAGTMTGTFGPGGPAFVFSFNLGVDGAVSSPGDDIVLALTSSTPFNGALVNYTGTVSFTDTNLFFSDFQLNQSGVGGITVRTTGGGTSAGTASNAFTGNIVSFTISGDVAVTPDVLNSIISNAIQCFCEGTRIATVDGPKPVETLVPGDRLIRADGRVTEVQWLGRQTVSTRFSDPEKVNPICITAGTLGNDRDLWVSRDHGIVIDGVLVNAGALVNGTTIFQAPLTPGVQDFIYYHVETELHEVILAEGVAVESYLDIPSRESFDNGGEREGVPVLDEMDIPRISSRRLLPKSIVERIAKTTHTAA